jgi:hypothetical protein
MEIFSGDPAAGRRKIGTSDPCAEADAGERGRRTEGQAKEVAPLRSSARLLAAQVPGLIHVFAVAEDDGTSIPHLPFIFQVLLLSLSLSNVFS